MSTHISVAAANAKADAAVDLIDASTPTPGYLEIYDGAMPATVATANAGNKLATLTFALPAFGAATNRVATANAIASDSDADASGTPTYARIYNGAGTAIMDVDAGVGSGSMNFNQAIVQHGVVSIMAMTYTQPLS